MTGTLPIVETFGPTFQGEGPSSGRLAHFIRFGRCNLSCTWCDTPYTWDYSRHDVEAEITERVPYDLVTEATAPLVVLTGGEPMLQSRTDAFRELLFGLSIVGGLQVEIETNGTIPPPDWTNVVPHGVRFNVSPKLDNAEQNNPLRGLALRQYADLAHVHRAVFKFVATSPSDLDQIREIVDEYHIPNAAVWVMPEGTSADKVMAGVRVLADPVLQAGWNLTPRLHTLVWEDERGR